MARIFFIFVAFLFLLSKSTGQNELNNFFDHVHNLVTTSTDFLSQGFSGPRYKKMEDPDYDKEVPELIKSRGFTPEIHNAVTDDGYYLVLHRVVNPKIQRNQRKKRPVIIQHGLGSSSIDYIINSPGGHVDEPIVNGTVGNNLAYELSKRGYDVWLSNSRGNRYSTKHKTLGIKNKKYWDFSFDEHAKYDVPAVIQFVKNSTGSDKVSWIGHSQGTVMMFALLSSRSEFVKIVEPFIAMAPVSFVTHQKAPAKLAARQQWLIDFFEAKGGKFIEDKLVRTLTTQICKILSGSPLCTELTFFFNGGYDSPQLNRTRIPVYFGGNGTFGTSSKNIVHYAQSLLHDSFRRFDYGRLENMRRYNSISPPDYNLEEIDPTHVALMSSKGDDIANPSDVQTLRSKLTSKGKKLLEDYVVPDPEFAHMDFCFGKDAGKYVYRKILDILKNYQK